MRKILVLLALCSIALGACEKERNFEAKQDKLSFVGKIEAGTKTSIVLDPANNASQVIWTASDKLGIFGVAPDGKTSLGANLAYSADESLASTAFSAVSAEISFGSGAGTRSFYAYHPYNEANNDFTRVQANIPAVQSIRNGANSSEIFMFASAQADKLGEVAFCFHKLYSLIELGLQFPGRNLKSLCIEPINPEACSPIAGDVLIDISTGEVVDFNNESQRIDIVFEGGLQLTETTVWVPINVLPFECLGGMKISFTDSNNEIFTKQIWRNTRINSDEDGLVFVDSNTHIRQPLTANFSDCEVLSMSIPSLSLNADIDSERKIIFFRTAANLSNVTLNGVFSPGANCSSNLSNINLESNHTIVITAMDGKTTQEWTIRKVDTSILQGKPRYIWIDCAANFPDFANSKENIASDVQKARIAGFSDIVVDVRPTTGDVLFKTDYVDQVQYQYAWRGGYNKFNRTEDWDYLQAFIDAAHDEGLRVHAAFNTFVGGNSDNGGTGLLYRDPSKRDWATTLNLSSGLTNVMDDSSVGTKFFNPAHPEVQQFLCNLLSDLAKYDLDGIILDRGRFDEIRSDFSAITRAQFEQYLGSSVSSWPADVMKVGATEIAKYYVPKYQKQWLSFRAKVIHDFMEKARKAVKDVNPSIKFGVYVGGWYSTYYNEGVNWASPGYNCTAYSEYGNTVNSDYKKYGFADLMDHMIIGAYASPASVTGSAEWTMQGFCSKAKTRTAGACPLVVGGPDVGNWDYDNKYTQAQENQAIVNSVAACINACDGYFLFDMIHLKLYDQWQYAQQGISAVR